MDKCCAAPAYLEALSAPAAPDRARESVIDVEGASCGACVARIESALLAVPGVASAAFALGTRRARVLHGESVTREALREAIARAGYRTGSGERADPARASRTALRRTGVAGLAMMQVMMLAFPVYVADEGTLAWDFERLFALASFALTIPVITYCAAPIWRAAWAALRAGHASMDVTVALGIGTAFVASLPATAWGGPVYYEAVTMVVFFLSAGRWLEARALAATLDAGEALEQLLPARAVRLAADGQPEDVPPSALRPGDRVWIAAGDAVPADCVLESGASDFNEALLTGESAPAARRAGDRLLAGSANLTAPVEARVERAGGQHTLAQARRLIERAASTKPRWAQLADRVAARFVVAVLVLAAAAGAAWLAIDASRALPVVIAVLVVSCPCALALAAPVARSACAGALARDGVLVTSGRALEALASVTRVVFDKTGTLTTGRMRLVTLDTFANRTAEECLAIAAALERAMPHPVAHAVAAARSGPVPAATGLLPRAGAGVEGLVDGIRYRVGSVAYCAEIAGGPAPFVADDGAPHAALAAEGRWLALMRFGDTLRPEAPEALARLRRLGVEASLVSGDRESVVANVARSTRITDAVSAASPDDKLRIVQAFVAAGDTVAMVGDGVNDAPALAAAHVGIAVGGAAAAARSQADLVLVNPSLLALAAAIETARRGRSIVAQNLGWAVAYNALSLPLAFSGVLTPWMASLGMSLSSLLVVANALRLARRRKAEG